MNVKIMLKQFQVERSFSSLCIKYFTEIVNIINFTPQINKKDKNRFTNWISLFDFPRDSSFVYFAIKNIIFAYYIIRHYSILYSSKLIQFCAMHVSKICYITGKLFMACIKHGILDIFT